MVGPIELSLGSLAFFVCPEGELWPKAIVISINCSSVGFTLTRTSVLCNIGWRSEMNRGDTKCSCE